jgi:hypothetical protein
MGNIVIFKEITTDEILLELEAESKKYDGLHVDMNNKDERKFVKDKASLVSGMLKKLDRKRIDESKEYKVKVEKEALDIKERLEIINLPFTALIDAHKAERAEILAEEKAVQDAKELLIQIASDYDDAIMEDKVKTFEKAEVLRQQIERDNLMKQEAAEQAIKQQAEQLAESERNRMATEERAKIEKQQAIEREEQLKVDAFEREEQARLKSIADIAQAKQDEINRQKAEQKEAKALQDKLEAEQARKQANTEHRAAIHKSAKDDLMEFAGLTAEQAVNVVTAIKNNKVSVATINY